MIEYATYSPRKRRFIITVVSIVGVLAQFGVALLALKASGNLG